MPPEPENKSHLHHLFAEVPFHQLEQQDLTKMNPEELRSYLQHIRAQRVSPHEKKKQRTVNAKTLTSKAPNIKSIALGGLT